MFKVMRIVMGKGVELIIVAELVGHIALTFIPLAIPIAILFSTIYTLNKLCSDSEFIAMRSVGLTRERLFMPFLIFSLIIGGIVFTLNSEVIPFSKREFRKVVNILTSKGLVSEIQKGNFFTEVPNIIVFAENVTGPNNLMNNVFINVRSRNKDIEKTIFAKTGVLTKEEENKWGIGQLRLVLENGSIMTHSAIREETEKILFERYSFPIITGNITVGNIDKGSMKSSEDLWQTLQETPEVERNDKNFIKSEIEFWSRFNTPILCLIFTLIGFSLGIQKSRGQARSSGSLAFIVLIAYYAIFFLGVSLARSKSVPAEVAVFLPTTIGLIAGLYFFRKTEWAS